jgi:hypothetical protein
MDFSNYRSIDPHLLVGLVNTALRNNCDSFEDFCRTHDLEPAILIQRLQTAGYHYKPVQNQFR